MGYVLFVGTFPISDPIYQGDYLYLYTLPSNAIEIVLAGTSSNKTLPSGFTATATATVSQVFASL